MATDDELIKLTVELLGAGGSDDGVAPPVVVGSCEVERLVVDCNEEDSVDCVTVDDNDDVSEGEELVEG